MAVSDAYVHWVSRVFAPRSGNMRVVSCNAAGQNLNLANDVLIFPQAANVNSGARAASYGRALIRFENDDASNTIYLVFGTGAQTANSAAASGGTVPASLYPRTFQDFEVDPLLDVNVGVATANGTANTATLRYWVRTQPLQSGVGSGNMGAV